MGFLAAHVVTTVNDKRARDPYSRAYYYKKAGMEPPMPKLNRHLGYLVEALMTLNPMRVISEGGVRPADWPEIMPFMQATRQITEPWEAEVIHKGCIAYTKGYNVGELPLGRSPLERVKDGLC